jgi:hypothetical protein
MSPGNGPAETREKVYRPAMSALLVGLDGSNESNQTLEWAAATAAQLDVLVVAVTAFEDLTDCVCGPARPQERDLLARRRRMIIDVMDRHPDADISHWRVQGPLAVCLCRMARAHDLLVVPASCGPRCGSDLFGYCLEHAPCTVIVVPVDRPAKTMDRALADLQEVDAESTTWLG